MDYAELRETAKSKIMKNKKDLLLTILSVFFIFSIVLVLVFIFNKIEYRKYIGQEFEIRNNITVSGEGRVFAKPDLAIVNFSVISEAKTVSEAMENNTQKMNRIISFMRENKIEDRDLKTIAFRISPRYEWPENGIRRTRVLVGYEVRQSLEIRIRDMEKIGTLIEGGTLLGANQVGSLQFIIDNKEELKNQAREQAIEKAKEKAETLAVQLNIQLKRIVDFKELDHRRPFDHRFDRWLEVAVPEPLAPEIEIGENEVRITVQITYEIK